MPDEIKSRELTEEKKERFLAALVETGGNVTRAAREAKMDKSWLYALKHDSKDFSEAWDLAVRVGVFGLEDEAIRRAKEGVEEPLAYKGQIQGKYVDKYGVPCDPDEQGATFVPNTITRYSDTLLMFLLKGAMPEKYRDNVNLMNNGKDLPPPVMLYLPDNKRDEEQKS